MGGVQYIKERSAPDGTQHGMRAGPAGDQSEHDLSGAYLYKVCGMFVRPVAQLRWCREKA
jgi:hypothetical protein